MFQKDGVSLSVIFVVSDVEDWLGCVFVVLWNDFFRVDSNEDDHSFEIVFVDAVAEEDVKKKIKMITSSVELVCRECFNRSIYRRLLLNNINVKANNNFWNEMRIESNEIII